MEKLIEQNLPKIKELFVKHGAESAYLFGSAAEGKMKAKSDVDFLFTFPENTYYEIYPDNYYNLLQ
jgi:predicted nucleotidyltransferase